MTRRSLRHLGLLVAVGLSAALGACGADSSQVTVATTPVATTAGSAPAPCDGAALAVDQVPLASGTGLSWTAWSLTDTGTAACTLAAGAPTVAFDDAAGTDRWLVPSTVLAAPGPARAVTIPAGGRAWFLSEETTTACGVGTTIDGGPFHYEIGLPGGGHATWAPTYLAGASLPDFCAGEALDVGSLQATEPAPPS